MSSNVSRRVAVVKRVFVIELWLEGGVACAFVEPEGVLEPRPRSVDGAALEFFRLDQKWVYNPCWWLVVDTVRFFPLPADAAFQFCFRDVREWRIRVLGDDSPQVGRSLSDKVFCLK